MSYSVKLSTKILYRYICNIGLTPCNKPFLKSPELDVPCIIDTACINTLVPLAIAKRCGVPLGKKSEVIVGGREYMAQAYAFDNVSFGNMKIPKMLGFAAAYEGDIAVRVLLGLNFLNNLKITLDRSSDTIIFTESVPDIAKHTEYPFTCFFDKPGLKPMYPNLLEDATANS